MYHNTKFSLSQWRASALSVRQTVLIFHRFTADVRLELGLGKTSWSSRLHTNNKLDLTPTTCSIYSGGASPKRGERMRATLIIFVMTQCRLTTQPTFKVRFKKFFVKHRFCSFIRFINKTLHKSLHTFKMRQNMQYMSAVKTKATAFSPEMMFVCDENLPRLTKNVSKSTIKILCCRKMTLSRLNSFQSPPVSKQEHVKKSTFNVSNY